MPRSSMKPRMSPASSFAHTSSTSAIGELVIQVFDPFSTNPPSTAFARVRIEAGSEPASGSVRPKQPTNSPVRSFGRYFCRCVFRAERVDRIHHQRRLHGKRRAVAGIDPLHLARDQAVADVVHAGAAVAFQGGAEEAHLAHLVHDLAVEFFLPVRHQHAREQLVLADIRARRRGSRVRPRTSSASRRSASSHWNGVKWLLPGEPAASFMPSLSCSSGGDGARRARRTSMKAGTSSPKPTHRRAQIVVAADRVAAAVGSALARRATACDAASSRCGRRAGRRAGPSARLVARRAVARRARRMRGARSRVRAPRVRLARGARAGGFRRAAVASAPRRAQLPRARVPIRLARAPATSRPRSPARSPRAVPAARLGRRLRFGARVLAALGALPRGLLRRRRLAAAPLAAVVLRPVDRIEALDDHRRNGVADQLLDRLDREAVLRRGDGEGVALQPGAAGAADAMDVVLGVDAARRN